MTDSPVATVAELPESALNDAAVALDAAQAVLDAGVARLASDGITENQVLAYDIAHAASGVMSARGLLTYGTRGSDEARITCAFVADVLADLGGKLFGRERDWGVEPGALDAARPFVGSYRSPEFLASLADLDGTRGLSDDFEMVQDTFRRFAEDKLTPIAEHIHRENDDIPEDIIAGLAEMGAFGLSINEEYGGFASGDESDYIAMVVATEELSRGSLGAGGSLITRPEILARALEAGGTEEQKKEWLPRLATAEVMNAVAVTEPDFGSDVAGVKTTATSVDGGYLINGVKTWCTFGARADVLMLLARTDPDRSVGHRGLSMFVVPKERGDGHGFELTSESAHGTGKMEGRPIDTIGYRGMHSYEIAFDNWFVPEENLIGGDERQGSRLLLPDGRVRERPVADRRPGDRGHAGRPRAGSYVLPGPLGLRSVGARLPAEQRQARSHGRDHPGCPSGLVRSGAVDGKGRGNPRGVDDQGVRLQGRRMGHTRSHADPRWVRVCRGVRRQPSLRRRPRALDLRGCRRGPVPARDRPSAGQPTRSRELTGRRAVRPQP